MMMLSQSAVNEALALLSVIASPAATRERLDQLVAESQRAKALFDQANAATQQLVADQKAWKEQTAGAALVDAERQVGLERRLAELRQGSRLRRRVLPRSMRKSLHVRKRSSISIFNSAP
jgi:hypothetical protein